jgi:hypothetical protein
LAVTLLSGCSSAKKSAVSSYGSVKGFLFPQVEPAAASAKLQWHLRDYEYRGMQTNRAMREHRKGR